ncbi:MAG: putative ABC transporter permease [Oscillospiraceae bacterium]
MAVWFWYWWVFSFLGYLLEKGYARATRARQQNRKCFVLLPLCPVYGFSVVAALLLPPVWRTSWPRLLLASALLPCAVEYLMHLYYDRCFHVQYWDYRGLPLNLRGRICLPFALAWTALMPLAVRWIAPALEPFLAAIPPWAGFAAWMLLAADWLVSRRLLLRFRDTELLSLRRLRRAA